MRNKLIGTKDFYKRALIISIPIMIQNGITNFVSLLDNIMVGRIGTEQMSGVAIVNQLIFVFNLCIFGGISGPGIYSSQYYGQHNHEGVKNAFRIKLIICTVISIIGMITLCFGGEFLIGLYLKGEANARDINATMMYAKEYLGVILLELLPFALVQAYAGTLRETEETMVPMKAGLVAVVVNLVLNYILIYGKFGAPALGAKGAAIATVTSRFVELAIVVIWTHSHKEKNKFAVNVFKHFKIPIDLVKNVAKKGTPLLLNETLWSAGMAILMQCYSIRGLKVVAAYNISSTISNVFNVAFIALGSAVAIIVGQELGAGRMKEAKDSAGKLIFFSVALCVIIGGVMAATAFLFPKIYNTTDEVKSLATWLIRVAALFMPMSAYLHCTYFTLRSGGKTIITFIFDSVYLWVISIPCALLITRFTSWDIIYVVLAVQSIDIVKCTIGFIMLKKGIWMNNIVGESKDSATAV